MNIQLTDPGITDAERDALDDVIDSGELKGGGKYWKKVNDLIESEFGGEKVMMTSSCTHALEMAALLLQIDSQDEVIIPSYTFPSTATAFARQGAKIRFCEVNKETFNMDPNHLRDIISSETTAVVPVHYAGIGCEMDKIINIANDYEAVVIEDAAQGVNSTYNDEALGTIGDIGCYSFHGTKSYSAGEGGAIVLNDKKFIERAEYIIHKGTDYSKFRRGEVDRYTWVDIGSSYVPSEMQSAVAYIQLKRRDHIRNRRQIVYEHYNQNLYDLEDSNLVQLPTVPNDMSSNYHLYPILSKDEKTRDDLIEFLRSRGIEVASHYEPLHLSKMGRKFGYEPGDLPQTSAVANRLLRLPIHEKLDKEDLIKVSDSVRDYYNSSN